MSMALLAKIEMATIGIYTGSASGFNIHASTVIFSQQAVLFKTKTKTNKHVCIHSKNKLLLG